MALAVLGLLPALLWALLRLSGDGMGNPVAWTQGAYVWQSAALLNARTQSTALSQLQSAGIERIYLGLDRSQSDAVATGELDVRALIDAAAEKQIKVDLLLGEPLWMKPAYRPDLLKLIASMAHLPFDRLHLDLEVDQLDGPVTEQYLRDWLDTLAASVEVSPWPITIDSHHRWFHAAPDHHPCVPCELPDIGVTEVSVMLYITDADRSAAIMQTIASNWPRLQFRLAQSVEHDQPASLSWHGKSSLELQRMVRQWRSSLKAEGVRGVDWQDWQSYPADES